MQRFHSVLKLLGGVALGTQLMLRHFRPRHRKAFFYLFPEYQGRKPS